MKREKIEFQEFTDEYYLSLKDEILSHNLASGEIILEIYYYSKTLSIKDLIFSFFEHININIDINQYQKDNFDFEKFKISKDKAIEDILFGLSTKPNYTIIDKEFNSHDSKRYAYQIIDFFKYPNFYTFDPTSRLWLKDIYFDTWWLSGGFIVVGNDKIGIFWVNDTY